MPVLFCWKLRNEPKALSNLLFHLRPIFAPAKVDSGGTQQRCDGGYWRYTLPQRRDRLKSRSESGGFLELRPCQQIPEIRL